MKLVQVQKTEDGETYILRGSEGELVAIDTDLFETTADLHEGIASGIVQEAADKTLVLIKMLFGQEAIDGLKTEVDALENLETVYEA